MSRPKHSTELELAWDQALAWRVSRHHLDAPSSDPIRLVSDVAGA